MNKRQKQKTEIETIYYRLENLEEKHSYNRESIVDLQEKKEKLEKIVKKIEKRENTIMYLIIFWMVIEIVKWIIN